jgi:hypothetical protein
MLRILSSGGVDQAFQDAVLTAGKGSACLYLKEHCILESSISGV